MPHSAQKRAAYYQKPDGATKRRPRMIVEAASKSHVERLARLPTGF
jgi:hypothetical protein